MVEIEREAMLYTAMGGAVRCEVCAHRCAVKQDKSGICRVRENREGKLYTVVYNNLASLDFNYIEKVPLYHFHPGARVVELGTVGCNFTCKFCCAWSISQAGAGEVKEEVVEPEKIAQSAKSEGCKGIVYTHTEPIVSIEYVYDVMRLAKKKGLFNVLVTNGYLTEEALDLLSPYIDALSITPKAFSDSFYREVCGARLEPVLETIERVHERDMHLEIAYVLIPGRNDSEKEIREISKFLVNLSDEIPLIFLRYFPSYEMDMIEMTREDGLNRAREIALEEGLRYVYVGNTYTNAGKNTYCTDCGELLIERIGERVFQYNLEGKACKCGTAVPIVGEYVEPVAPYY